MPDYAKYNGTVLNPSNGEAVYGVSITVKLAGTDTLADLYTDEIGTAGPNPVSSATDGKFWFYIEPGDYDLYLSGTGISPTTLSDVTIGNILLRGRSGGLTVYGGIDSGDDLILYSTSHATKGKIYFGANAYYNEADDVLLFAQEKGFKLQTQGTPFSFSSGSSVFNATRDDWLQYGYNFIPGTTTRINLTEPMLKWNMEANFNAGAQNLMEVNLDYLSSDGLTTLRFWSFSVNRATHLGSWIINADNIQFFNNGGSSQYLRLGGASAAINQKLSIGSDDPPTGILFINGDTNSAGNISLANGKGIGQATGPWIAFDDTNNYLEITGCLVGIGTTTPTKVLDVVGEVAATLSLETPGVVYSTGTGTALSGFAVNSSALVVDTNKSIPYHGISWKTFSDAPGNLSMTAQGYNGIRLYTTGLERARIDGAGNVNIENSMRFTEMTAPVGVANKATIFAQDNGAGKTQLMVIFGSGVAQQLAIEA